MFKDSKIVQSNEVDLILSWFDKKPSSFKLLLDANIDNNFWNNFYNNCRNKSPTILFIKTTENLRFGGFTSVIWPENGAMRDESSFIFSLSKKQKYKIKDPYNAIGVSKNSWISFGNGMDLYIYNNLKTQGGGTYKNSYNIPEAYELNNNKPTFNLLNCEIYQIIYQEEKLKKFKYINKWIIIQILQKYVIFLLIFA